MTDHRLDQREASSPPSPSSPLDAAGPGASSRPAPAARRTLGPSAGSRRLGLVLAAGAAAGTLAVALAVAVTGPSAAPAADAAAPAAAAAATAAAPTDQVVVDTVYVRDPAPTANPEPIVVPAPAAPAAEAQVVRVVRVVAGGDHEGAEHDGAEHDGDHEGAGVGGGGEDD